MTYIWDLDGTLIDSYPGIIKSVKYALNFFNISFLEEEIYKRIIEESVVDFFKYVSEKYSIKEDDLFIKYQEDRIKNDLNVSLMDGAYNTLKALYERKDNNFLFTHNGIVALDILKENNIYSFFKEVVTKDNHFERKPNPEAINYILNKYNINKEEAFYVGDRPIDILCAKNAGIKSVLFKAINSPINITADRVIKKLEDLI